MQTRTHIYGKFGAHPRQLPGVRGNLLDTASMGLGNLDGVLPQGVDDLQVLLKHVRVLVILARDVLFDGGREGEGRRLAEGQAEEVAGGGSAQGGQVCESGRWRGIIIRRLGRVLTWPWFCDVRREGCSLASHIRVPGTVGRAARVAPDVVDPRDEVCGDDLTRHEHRRYLCHHCTAAESDVPR
jgi:hypothetical protein